VDTTPSGEPVRATAFRIGPEVNHYYAQYDDTDGITVLFEHTHNSELAMYVRDGDTDAWGRPCDPRLVGMYNHPMHPAEVTVMRFDPETGAVTERASLWEPDCYYAAALGHGLERRGHHGPDPAPPGVHRVPARRDRQPGHRPYRDRLRPFPDHEIPRPWSRWTARP
jgi:hypothetical protein